MNVPDRKDVYLMVLTLPFANEPSARLQFKSHSGFGVSTGGDSSIRYHEVSFGRFAESPFGKLLQAVGQCSLKKITAHPLGCG